MSNKVTAEFAPPKPKRSVEVGSIIEIVDAGNSMRFPSVDFAFVIGGLNSRMAIYLNSGAIRSIDSIETYRVLEPGEKVTLEVLDDYS